MKTIPFAVLFLALTNCLLAQPQGDTLWTRLCGWGEARSVQQTTDGGYIIGGNFGRLMLLKTDSNGDTTWRHTYGPNPTNVPDIGETVQQTADGGYILVGTTWERGPGIPDYGNIYVVKTNSQGDSLWTRVYGGSNAEYGRSVRQTTDGGYVIAGSTESYGPSGTNMYLVRTNSTGDTVWTRTYGGATGDDAARSVHQTTDGGFILVGSTDSFGLEYANVYLVKTNSVGDTLWTRNYGGNRRDQGWSVQQTSDGGYIIGAETWSYGVGTPDAANFYLIKTNSQGDTVWTRVFGGSYDDRGRFALQTTDGGYVIVGSSSSFGVGTPTEPNYYLVKTNSQGDTLWTHAYGGTREDWATCVQQTADGGYIMVGDTWFPDNWTNTFLVKTAPDSPPPPLRLESPNGGERWPLFSRQNVTWTSQNPGGEIRIELNRNYPSGDWEMLTESTANDGSEAVNVTGPLANACRIRISLIGDTLSDISDHDFAITTSQGTLRLVYAALPSIPVNVWDAGQMLETDTLTEVLRLKNFGTEAIVIFPPSDLQSDEFSMASDCDTLSIAPGAMAACDLRLSYHPQVNGQHFDTLAIRTNASNGDADNYFYLPLTGQLSLAAGDRAGSVPTAFALHAAFPNPFNATTVITYDLPKAGHASLRIFDVQGREVIVLADGDHNAGTHRRVFDSAMFSSGVYFARLEAGEFSQTLKLMALK